MSTSLSFEETLSGYLSQNASAYRLEELSRRNFHSKASSNSKKIFLTLRVRLDELSLIKDPFDVEGSVDGTLTLDDEIYEIAQGSFHLMAKADGTADADTLRQMRYQLKAESETGHRITLLGQKHLKAGRILQLWQETTTLLTSVYEDYVDFENSTLVPIFVGNCKMSVRQVAETLPSFRSNAEDKRKTLVGASRYLDKMSRGFMRIYHPLSKAPSEAFKEGRASYDHLDAEVSEYDFMTEDGFSLKLTRFARAKAKDSVLLLHGLTTSTSMFTMKEHTSIVEYLLDNGYEDVWSLDWRGSGRFPYNLEGNDYTLDHVIAFDIPNALSLIRKHIGSKQRLHAIGHCIGSLTMASALAAGKAKGITSFIGNSVSLTPSVSPWSRIKLKLGPDILENVLKINHLGPGSARAQGITREKLLAKAISWVHPESTSPECNMVSFLWGSGYPAAYNLENLHPETYAHLGSLFGGTSFKLYRHIERMASTQSARPNDSQVRKDLDLPEDYLAAAKSKGLPPTLLLSGSLNKIFPGSNLITYKHLAWSRPDLKVQYLEIPDYGHQDVFMGRAARVDVFPRIIDFLNAHQR